jgi:hypothetical protein
MPVIDLTRYIVASAGLWIDPPQEQSQENLFGFTRADTVAPERLMLRWAGDFVALTGPLRARVTVQAENLTVPLAYVGHMVPDAAGVTLAGGTSPQNDLTLLRGLAINTAASRVVSNRGLSLQASTIYSYILEVAAGQAWPFSLSEQLDALRLRSVGGAAFEQLGNNLGFRVIIEPAFATPECTPVTPTSDLPCDFAVADRPDTARFFPTACEPCEGSVIGLPPTGTMSLVAPAAAGGCVRTRFFNGMFITQEDLETEQRYHRLKSKLHNRAAGAGVVWGLGVGKQGSQVCVLPGYGVDCCGNDLALTTTYKVEIAALIADPAAAGLVRQKGPQRLHLLLEYVECPSDPRPVHGDPCAPEASRCEMSRIRESVRLRLVPPRDCSPAENSAPIQRFLDEVRALRARYPLGDGPVAAGGVQAPFRLQVEAPTPTPTNTAGRRITVRPTASNDIANLKSTLTDQVPEGFVIEISMDSSWKLVRGIVSGQAFGRDGSLLKDLVNLPDPVDVSQAGFGASLPILKFDLPQQADLRPARIVYRLAGWQAQHFLAGQDDPAPAGDLTLAVIFSDNQIKEIEFDQSSVAARPLDLAPNPCSGEPCATRRVRQPADVFDRAAMFENLATTDDPETVLPWLHADPVHAGSAGDPKVLALAALGGWLMQMAVREGEGTANAISTPRREIAQGIYRVAWLLLFGLPEKADPAALGGALQRLLEAWCDNLLWKGPECCGEPHGVVIGCAVVEGGTIQRIDPFGGRRYVMHYPLLAHWGTQFGIAPPDLSLGRLFSTLCCIAGLPALGVRSPELPTGLFAIGSGHVAVGDPAQIAARIQERKFELVAQRRVGTPELIASSLAVIGKEPAEDNRRYTALVLADVVADQTVMLLLPSENTKQKL